MSNIISECNSQIFDQYMTESNDQLQMLKNQTLQPKDETILELISDYNTFKLLLAQQELKLANLQLELDIKQYTLKQEYMQEGYKSTEAREKTRQDTKKELEKIHTKEYDINILKSCIHSTEYQLRYFFLLLKSELIK